MLNTNRILYDDDSLSFCNKIKLINTHPNSVNTYSALALFVTTFVNFKLLNRIDYGTSGQIIVCKISKLNKKETNQFLYKKPIRIYLSFCENTTLDINFISSYKTNFDLLSKILIFKGYIKIKCLSLLKCSLITGKRNQIRLTLQNIYCDKIYNKKNLQTVCVLESVMHKTISYQLLTNYLSSVVHPIVETWIIIENRIDYVLRYVLILLLSF